MLDFLPDYIKDNTTKLFIGLVTVLVLAVPAGFYAYKNLPASTKTTPTNNTKVVQNSKDAPQKYTNPQYKYSLSYPKNWVKKTAEPTELYTDELFFPSNTAATESAKTVGVRVFQSVGSEWNSVQDYFKQLLNQPMGENIFENGRIVKLANVKVDGYPAVMQTEEATTADGLPFYSKNVYVAKDNLLYVIMNSAQSKAEADTREKEFNSFVSSFKFIK